MISFNHVFVWIRFAACFNNTFLSSYVTFANFCLESCSQSHRQQKSRSVVGVSACFMSFVLYKKSITTGNKKRKNCLKDSQFENWVETVWHEINKENTWMLCNKWNFLPTLSLKNSVIELNVLHHMALVSFHSFYILLSTFHLFVVCFVSLSICAF